MNNKLPFRTESKHVPIHEDGFFSGEADRPTFRRSPAELINHIESSSFRHPDVLERWLLHPDERVVLATLERYQELRDRKRGWPSGIDMSFEEVSSVARQFQERALRQAWKEGAHWTPMLDGYLSAGFASRKKPDSPGKLEEELTAQLDKLENWIAGVQDLNLLKPLLKFKSKHVYACVGHGAQAFDRELVRGLVGRFRSVDAEAELMYRGKRNLLDNPNLFLTDLLELHDLITDSNRDNQRAGQLYHLAAHPSATQEGDVLLELIIRSGSIESPKWLDDLVDLERVHQSSKLRRLLVAHAPYRAYQKLLDYPDADLADLTRIAARRSPRRVLSDFKRDFKSIQKYLGQEEVQILLEADDRYVRREALRLLGELKHRKSPEQAEGTPSRSSGR